MTGRAGSRRWKVGFLEQRRVFREGVIACVVFVRVIDHAINKRAGIKQAAFVEKPSVQE